MSPKDLSSRLSERALDVCLQLFPNGKQEGFLFKVGSVNGDDGKSLQVNVGGQWMGKWRDWADDSFHGDLLDLWQHAKGLTPPDARKDAMGFLGITLPQSVRTYTFPPEAIGSSTPTPEGKVMLYLTDERKLEPSIINRFRVEAKADTKEIVFPCHSPSGTLINRSYCKLTRGEDGKKAVRQDKGCAPCLFGWQSFDEADWKKGYVVICEGHIDAMTWRQWGHPALSIPNGGGMTWIDYSFEDLEVFDKIYVSFDMDGKVDPKPVPFRLGVAKTALVSLPHKDANDCLKAGLGASDAQQWLDNAKITKLPHIQTAVDLKTPFLRRMQEGDNTAGWASSLFKFYGRDQFRFRPAEVTLWVGISNHGKSSFLRFLFSVFLKADMASGICSLEVPCDKTLRSIYLAYGASTFSPSEWLDAVGENIVFFDKVGYAEEKELCEAIDYCARRYAIQHFMIDSLMRIAGLEEDYPRQGQFMNRMQEVAKKTGVHIHIVAHERKTSDDDGSPDPNGIKGSSLLRNNADNIFFIRRNMVKRNGLRDETITEEQAEELHDTTVYLEKDRETGFTGKMIFKYNKANEQFHIMMVKPSNGTNGTKPNLDPYRGKARALQG